MNPLSHRAVLSVKPGAGANGAILFERARQEVSKWLVEKIPSFDGSLVSGSQQLEKGKTLALVSTAHADGSEASLRLQLIEDVESGFWRTSVTALSGSAATPATLAIDLESLRRQGGSSPGRPRLIRRFVEALPIWDGPVRLATAEEVIVAGDVDRLVRILTDPDRRLPAIVGARPLHPDPEWDRRWSVMCRESAGVASHFLLSDADAVDAFRTDVYDDHYIAPGAVRTFQIEVDPAWPADALRHRVLSGRRFSDRTDQAWRNIYLSVQRQAVVAELPEELRVALASGAAVDAAVELRRSREMARAHPDLNTGTVEQLRSENTTLQAIIESADQEIEDLTTQLAFANDSRSSLLTQFKNLEDNYALSALEQQENQAELHRAKAEVRRLQNLLAKEGRAAEAFDTVDIAAAPIFFEDLLDRLTELPYVLFTGDPRRTVELDDDDAEMGPVWAGKAWDALLALNSYGEHATSESGYSGNFRTFCEHPPNGAYVMPARQVAVAESGKTMQRWGEERRLPVPVEIDPTEETVMVMHLKLGSKNRIAPRIYFYDDTAGPTRKVVVGLIARHLTNTKT